MNLLNVSFGFFVFTPYGLIFIAFVIIMEGLYFSKKLDKTWTEEKIFYSVFKSNFISGLLGIIISMKLNGGWKLVVWFPWVSGKETDFSTYSGRFDIISLYIGAFILTIIMEGFTNWIFLRKLYETKKILKLTLIANIISYAIGSLVLYSFSFGWFL